MDTETLRWFQHVADGMTVTEVAQTYAVSQPGVSRALARLEEELGTPLLQRSGRVLRLTHAGAEFKAHVDKVMAEFDDGVAAIEQLLDPGSGIVTLGYPLSLGAWLVPDLVRAFRELHPRVRILLQRTSIGERGAISRLLATRSIDLELTTERVAGPGIQWRPVLIEPLYLAVPRNHRLAAAATIDLGEVAQEPFVMRRSPSGMRELALSLCVRAGFEPEIAYEVDDLPTARGLVAVGEGVSIVPSLGRAATARGGRVALVPLADPEARREIGLAWHSERRLLPSARAFRRFVLTRASA
ncbi:MAG: LysR family transcriptional regulator [Actinobacteria bacterium]|uniref:LysR family transcriptional regulator n=1 Tax=Nostocoides veronense TaxID=330836 RepID=A0ABN2LNX7_9MICO|nr:LysR family transcriptional regulator [Actinomycetota bacterium]